MAIADAERKDSGGMRDAGDARDRLCHGKTSPLGELLLPAKI
jgi:hypothetical protein